MCQIMFSGGDRTRKGWQDGVCSKTRSHSAPPPCLGFWWWSIFHLLHCRHCLGRAWGREGGVRVAGDRHAEPAAGGELRHRHSQSPTAAWVLPQASCWVADRFPPPQICHPGSFSLTCDKLPGVLCRLPCSVMLEDHSTIGPVGGTVLAVAHAFAVGGCRVTGSA